MAQATPAVAAKDGTDAALLSEKAADLKISDAPSAAPATTAPQTDATADALIQDASAPAAPSEKSSAAVVPQTDATADAVIKDASATTGPSEAELAPQGITKLPIPAPLPTSKPIPRPELSETEKTKYDELLTTVKAWTTIAKSAATGAEQEPLTDSDRIFLTREQLLRYLRATKWDVPAAAKRLQATLTWRREYGINGFTHDYISPENETGKQLIQGFDNEGRPCLYLHPANQNTKESPRQLQHLFYMIERVIELAEPGQESLVLLINFADVRKGQGATMAQSKTTVFVLQNHYPERLGRALISELPWYITIFFKVLNPFIDPITRAKIKFNEPMATYVPAEQLLKQFGGNVEFEYDHSVYWPALEKLCLQKRQSYFQRWERAGKQVGEHEMYLKGGDAKSLNGECSGRE